MNAAVIFETSSSETFFLYVLFVSLIFLTVSNVLFKVFFLSAERILLFFVVAISQSVSPFLF